MDEFIISKITGRIQEELDCKFKLSKIRIDKNSRKIYFDILVSSYINAKKKAEIEKSLQEFLNYHKVYSNFIEDSPSADEIVLKFRKYIKENFAYANSLINYEKLKVVVSENLIYIEISGNNNFVSYFQTHVKNDLMKYLERISMKEFQIKLTEDDSVVLENENFPSEIYDDDEDELRAIEVENVRPFLREKISRRPAFICDVDKPYHNAVLSGVLNNFARKEKKNKEELLLKKRNPYFYTFDITDISQTSIKCLVFPPLSAEKKFYHEATGDDISLVAEVDEGTRTTGRNIRRIKNGDTLLCEGEIREDNRSGDYLMFVRRICLCDYKKGQKKPNPISKKANLDYFTIIPEKLDILKQSAMFDSSSFDASVLGDKPIVFFDIETTGLNKNSDKIIEIGAVKVENGKLTEKFSTLVNPMIHIPDKATEINNITDDMVKNSPTIEDVLPDFFKWTRKCILSGYNIKDFDVPFIQNAAKKIGYYFDNDILDVIENARNSGLRINNFKLETVSRNLGVFNENAHRAYEDAYTTAIVLIKLKEREIKGNQR